MEDFGPSTPKFGDLHETFGTKTPKFWRCLSDTLVGVIRGPALVQCLRHVISLASLAYIFSGIHTIQYSSVDYDMTGIDIKDHDPQENDSTSHSGFTSTTDTLLPQHNKRPQLEEKPI